jgi:hypothetical protein
MRSDVALSIFVQLHILVQKEDEDRKDRNQNLKW